MYLFFVLTTLFFASTTPHNNPAALNDIGWMQWGMNSQHTGMMPVSGQKPEAILADISYDPIAPLQIQSENGLFIHYQTALAAGSDVYMEYKTGKYTQSNWNLLSWGEMGFQWEHGRLIKKWKYSTDWKPVPKANGDFVVGPFWEPVFHGALVGDFFYVPAFGGAVAKIRRTDGHLVKRFQPFGASGNENIFVAGPLSADDDGNIYYNAVSLNSIAPWSADVLDSWIVKIQSDGRITKTSFATLTSGAPAANAQCERPFVPEFPTDKAPTVPCGTQRPAINVAPAIAKDGTIYTISRAHFSDRYGYVVAITPDLKPKWIASLRDRLQDGCGVLVPYGDEKVECRPGMAQGVDPFTNSLPAGRVTDDSTSSPTVAPDGSVFYGGNSQYNCYRGHLFHFSPAGEFVGSYGNGWDQTPAIYTHNGTYSVLLKENHYPAPNCKVDYYITQLNSQLKPEWKFKSRNQLSCKREDDGTLSCKKDHPNGFEWCVNAVAIDKDGLIYANSEDGNLYVIGQGGKLKNKLFLKLAVGAAYTPMTLGPDGKIYAQNAGHLFVVGNRQ